MRVADSMRRKSLRASARLRERRTSRWVLPSAVRLISYCCDSGWQRRLVIAMECRARLRSRSPPRPRRCRVRWPLLASSGATPASAAKAASPADPAGVGPADEQLGGGDWPNTGFGEQYRPGGVLPDQGEQLRVKFGGLSEKEADPGGDRPHREHRDPMLDARLRWADEVLDAAELDQQRATPQRCPQVLRRHHDQALELVDRLGAADQDCSPGSHDLA